MPQGQLTYPFSAIVGQEKLKLALILNAIDPRIGGLLISGAKGTGKSLAVRAFAAILPEVETVETCPFNCNPESFPELCPTCRSRFITDKSLPTRKRRIRIVQLPISVTEDRLIGSLDVEAALKNGRKTLLPGLLAEANQNILYIDEINLLPDYLINCLLDPTASGWNVIQREGLSRLHPSRFTLIASMNPEEGELRPQIFDRFAFHVKTESLRDLEQRMLIIQRQIAFEKAPVRFCERFEQTQNELKNRIVAARELLPELVVSDQMYDRIAQVCADLGVAGFRSDLAVVKGARALAAFRGKTAIEPEDILEVFELVLRHRHRRNGDEADVAATITERLQSLAKTVPPDAGESEMERRPQTKKDIQMLLELGPISPGRRRRRRRGSRIFTYIYPFALALLVFTIYFITISTVSLLYHVYSGLPLEDFSGSVSLGQLWPYLALGTLVTLLLPRLFTGVRKKRRVPVYSYHASGGSNGRRIIRQITAPLRPSEDPYEFNKMSKLAPSTEKILNIPLYASFTRLYKLILGRGPRIAENLRQFRQGEKKYQFSLVQRLPRRSGGSIGRRVKMTTSLRYGRYVCYKFPQRKPLDIALAPTIRAAAPFQIQRKMDNLMVTIKPQDIRVKVREARAPLTILVLLDMSDSMGVALDKIRDTVLSMHDIAYKKRDRISLVVFKGSGATVLQPPTTNVSLLEKKLLDVGVSDFTPLAAGMFQAWRVLRNEKMRNRDVIPILIIISDGITNVALERPVTSFTRPKFLNNAQADVIDVAGLLQRGGIRTVVINTVHEGDEKARGKVVEYAEDIAIRTGKRWLDPTSLLLELSRITGGYYYGIGEGGEIESAVLMDAFTIIDRGLKG